jgi:hypothetical protein
MFKVFLYIYELQFNLKLKLLGVGELNWSWSHLFMFANVLLQKKSSSKVHNEGLKLKKFILKEIGL